MVQINGFKTETKHSKIEPEYFKGDNLGARFGNTLIGFFKRIVNSTTDWFEERLINFAVGVLVKVETSGKTVLGSLVKELKKHKAIPDFLKPIFNEIEDPKHEIGALLATGAGTSAVGGLFGAIFDPLMAPVKYLLMEGLHPMFPPYAEGLAGFRRGAIDKDMAIEILDAYGIQHKFRDLMIEISRTLMGIADIRDSYLRGDTTEEVAKEYIKKQGYDDIDVDKVFKLFIKIPPVAESILAYFRGKITETELTEIAKKNGIDDSFLDILITANQRLLGFADIRNIFYREDKSEDWLNTQLDKLGLDETAREDIKKIMPFYPTVGDLVRFAVREVYYPDYVSKYGLEDEYPPEYEKAAQKAGLDPEQAKNYWKAHWELPSILQGYEMLHRRVIGSEELGDLFKAVDIMPYWRERLEKISYRVFTRVDVRRMYRDGVLTEAQVLEAYKDLGYDDEKALAMTEFTLAFYTEKDKDLTRANITDGYEREYFSEGEATELLQDLGYTTEQAEYYTSKVDYDKEIDKKKKYLSFIEDEYKKGVKTENETISALTEEGFKSTEIEFHLNSWNIEKKAKPETPSKADLKSWLAKKIVSRETFIEEMRNTGFADKYINYYLKELKQREI